MSEISAIAVKELREISGAGMMDCKNALSEASGDLDKAMDILRKSGIAKAQKKSGRSTKEGMIYSYIHPGDKLGVMIEVNCETDFVARADSFTAFAVQVADYTEARKPNSLDQLLDGTLKTGESIEDTRNTLIGSLGENVSVRRFQTVEVEEGRICGYLHGRKIGVLVSVRSGAEELGHDLAMHIAASNPLGIDESGIPDNELIKERERWRRSCTSAGRRRSCARSRTRSSGMPQRNSRISWTSARTGGDTTPGIRG